MVYLSNELCGQRSIYLCTVNKMSVALSLSCDMQQIFSFHGTHEVAATVPVLSISCTLSLYICVSLLGTTTNNTLYNDCIGLSY